MKKIIKKLASFLMAGAMVFTPIPTHAYACNHSDSTESYLSTSYAFAESNPEHMKSEMYTNVCNDCGESKTIINATLELHTFDSSGKCICGYEKVAGCKHNTTEMIYSSVEYWTHTTLEHLKYYYFNIVCVNCGEVVDEATDYYWESHTFSSDEKCECGYEKTKQCKHSNTENVCALVEYRTHTTLEHLKYYLYDVTCVSCRDVVTNIHDFEWESHTFNSDGKCACGYAKKPECSHDKVEKVCVSETICYGEYTKEKHAVKSEYEVICTNCGKKTAEDSKENWILHEFDSNGRCDCGYSNLLKCKHDNVEKEYDRYEYEEYNTKKHYVDEYYNHICENCGKIVDTSCESSLEKHELDSRGACYCGYKEEIECKHKDTTKTEYKKPKVFSYSAEKHVIKYYYEIICEDCDEVVDTTTDTEYYPHRYNSYGECECGDEKKTLSTIVLKNGNKTVYVNGNKTTWEYAPKNMNGTTMVPLTIAVEALGGEYVSWDANLSQAVVRLNGDEITYQKNAKQYWVNSISKTSNEKAQIVNGKLYVELKTLLNITNQVANYKDGYIIISEDWLTQNEMQKVIDEMFGESDSSDDEEQPSSGNQQDDSVDLTDIKAGKVYSTGSDGKHIYKRTYDPSKALQYDDVYVYTLTNFTLPKDAALIISGNYLYLDGEKVSASPSILQEADKRITHLNKIIDGANNAHNANTIDKNRRNEIRSEAESVIQEYKKVMEGKTSLSKVSEMKKSYKAKVGQNNSTVKQIQEKLYELGYTSQLTTGYYGDITFNNVAYFQIVNGLTVTGWVDSQTYNLINQSYENLNSTSTTEIQTPELVELEDLKWEEVEKPSNWDYIVSSGKQFVLGNFTEDVTVLGTGLQVGAGIIGIDAPMDFRDVTADLANWEWSWPHAFQTTIDVIAFVPVIGALKYTDEAAVLIKSGDKIFLAKHADEVLTAGKNLDKVLSKLKYTDNFADGKLKHIFSGEINKSGKAVGFHYEGLDGASGKVTKVTKQPNKYGVYEATVEINGKAKDNISTFFPKEWTPQQVVDAINEAFDNRVLKNSNMYEGTLSNGMKIRMAVENGKITTAYPIY